MKMKQTKEHSDEYLQARIKTLIQRGRALNLTDEDIKQILTPSKLSRLFINHFPTKFNVFQKYRLLIKSKIRRESRTRCRTLALCVLVAAIAIAFGYGPHVYNYVTQTACLVEDSVLLEEILRPLMPCSMCQNLTAVPEVSNISQVEFERLYAYTMVPVLVKGAMRNWTAVHTFSFEFFKDLYQRHPGSLWAVENTCQFFPYKTGFSSLREAFDMPLARATFQEGQDPWYIGWSNCHQAVSDELRTHYKVPDFLPEDFQTDSLEWFFMGFSGKGAGVHIDNVKRPSWQAQVSGKKTWTLLPGPECEAVCSQLEVTVEKGDIIVLDTNIWYHSTFIHPGNMSITIGGEFD